MKLKIKKGDTVQVIAGSDKGKKGEVLAINTSTLKIKVNGVCIQTHFNKKDGEIKKLEGFIDYSNVKLADAKKAKAAPKKKAKTTKTVAAKA
jgi:large subunit ribosomal protein L24